MSSSRSGEGWSGTLWGAVPVQGEGVVDGRAWTFHARGDACTVTVGDHVWRAHAVGASYLDDESAWELVQEGLAAFRDPLVQVMLGLSVMAVSAAWTVSRHWQAMAALAARLGGPVEAIRRTLWTFGIHPRMEPGDDGGLAWDLPLDHEVESATDVPSLDGRIADAIRALWTPPEIR